MQSILVSIVIPVYNSEKTLHRCLQSVIQQTHSNIQIVVVDDGSTDSSQEICRKYLYKDERVEYYYKENGGASSARNVGISKVKGNYLQFVDSDDYIDPDLVISALNSIIETNADVTVFGLAHEYHKRRRCTEFGSSVIRRSTQCSLAESIVYLQDLGLLGYACNKLYKMTCINKNLILFREDIRLYEDLLFNCAFFMFAEKVTIAKFSKYHYVQSCSSVSSTLDKHHFKNTEQAANALQGLMSYCGVDSSVIKRILYQFTYYSTISFLFRLGRYSYRDFALLFGGIFEHNIVLSCFLDAHDHTGSLHGVNHIVHRWIVKRRTRMLYYSFAIRNLAKCLIYGENRF